MRFIILFFYVIGMSVGYAQPIVRECFNKKGIVDEEANSEYCVVGKKVLRFDERRGSGYIDTIESYVDTVRAFYAGTNKPKFLRIYSQDAYREGNFEEYYPNGTTKESGSYKKGHKSGFVSNYHPSGKKQSTLQYFPDQRISDWYENDYKIIDYWDSSGTQMVVGGNGMCRCRIISGRDEIGKVVNGLRDSIWSEYQGDTLVLTEQYSHGKFIEGVRYDDGAAFKYTTFEQMAEFSGGAQGMATLLRKNLSYPQKARKNKIQGAVFTSFVVDKDGTIYDLKVIKGISDECDQEALRVVALLTPWSPGRQRGRAVKSRFVLPIRFML